MAIAIAVAGRIGSGKTTVTKSVALSLGWPRASFGDYVRAVAKERGLPQTRTQLQELGTSLLRSDPPQFCAAVLHHSGWRLGENLIIDGLRHAETIPIIRGLVAPAPLKIVLISVPEETRLKRLAARGDGDKDSVASVEAHSSEQQVASALGDFADFIVNGDHSVEAVAQGLCEWIRNQQWHQ